MKPFLAGVLAVVSLCLLPAAGTAADLPSAAEPVPSIEVPVEAPGEPSGIWAAIAFSPADGRHGFFWGADRRDEAEALSLHHCINAGGADCRVVETFRNHRHWDDDDRSGFPYLPCGALAVGPARDRAVTTFAARSAATRREAETVALAACEAGGATCRIREWVCT